VQAVSLEYGSDRALQLVFLYPHMFCTIECSAFPNVVLCFRYKMKCNILRKKQVHSDFFRIVSWLPYNISDGLVTAIEIDLSPMLSN
jgi:hypothetical protein